MPLTATRPSFFMPDPQKLQRVIKKTADNNGNVDLANLDASMDIADKLDEVVEAVKDRPEPPEVQKIEIVNEKEIPDLAKAFFSMLKGDKGDQGEPGEEGKPGKDGEQGVQGKSGSQGPRGEQGERGADGEDGDDGRDGRDGRDGKDGEQGSPDTGEDIRKKLESLKPGDQLDAKYIKNIDQYSRIIIQERGPGGKGFVETPLKAGANISITRDATGALVITGTSGGGSANVIFGEVVAGSSTTFTLSQTPSGTISVSANGQVLKLTQDYTIVGAVITTLSSWSAGAVIADYKY